MVTFEFVFLLCLRFEKKVWIFLKQFITGEFKVGWVLVREICIGGK